MDEKAAAVFQPTETCGGFLLAYAITDHSLLYGRRVKYGDQSRLSLSVCLSVCLRVCVLWLSTPNLLHIHSMAVCVGMH